jgi:hypothetical protein
MTMKNMRSVKGWLLVFAILSAVSMLLGLWGIIKLLTGMEFQDSLVFAIAWLVTFIANLTYLILIFRKSRKIKMIVFAGKILEIAAWFFLMITIWSSTRVDILNLSTYLIGFYTAIIQITLSIVWIVYFAKSKIVNETFA